MGEPKPPLKQEVDRAIGDILQRAAHARFS
jgi:hypothetical protein